VLAAMDTNGENEPGSIVEGIVEGLQQEAERIFRLLKMMYPDHDLHSAYVGLQSTDPIVRDNAVEFLEAILAPHLRSQIIPLFDRNVSIADRAQLGSRLIDAPVITRGRSSLP
jgi:hypothetical protein